MSFQISIDSLAGGALAEKLNIELRKLAENVQDPNTKADAVRTITCTIKVKPDENRQLGSSEISVKSSLAPSKGIPASFIFDFDRDGKAVVREMVLSRDPNQLAVDNDGDVSTGDGRKVVGMFR